MANGTTSHDIIGRQTTKNCLSNLQTTEEILSKIPQTIYLLLRPREVWHDNITIVVLASDQWWNVFLPPSLMNSATDNNHIQFVMVLHNFNFFHWVSVNQYAIRIKSLLDFAQLMGAHEEFSYAGCGGNDGFQGCESKKIHEVCQIMGIYAMWNHANS